MVLIHDEFLISKGICLTINKNLTIEDFKLLIKPFINLNNFSMFDR